MKTDFYVYGLFAPGRKKGELFYIGKGTGNRSKAHFYTCKKGPNPHKDNVISKYPGCYPKIFFDNLSEDEAFELEKVLIAKHKEHLTNATNGGEGISGYAHTAETKAKISKAKKGAYGGEKHPMYGKTHSDESKAKMSKAKAGEKSAKAKLTWEQVREIRERLAAGETQIHLAKEFGVVRSLISKIKNNKAWALPTDMVIKTGTEI